MSAQGGAAGRYQRVEYGLRVDCAKQGCDPKHRDDGEIGPTLSSPFSRRTINGHAATQVERSIITTDWQPTDDASPCLVTGAGHLTDCACRPPVDASEVAS